MLTGLGYSFGYGWMMDMVKEEELKERVEKFKSLIKQGYNVSKALRESKLHMRDYKRLYGEIWSDPEMAPLKPKLRDSKRREKAGESGKGNEKDKKPSTDSPVEDSIKRLAQYGMSGEKTPFEREFEELEGKRRMLLQAAQNVLMKYGAPGPSDQSTLTARGRDSLAEFEAAFKDFEEKRNRIKRMLEEMGFKVEDVYMKKDEVERLLKDAKRRATEEALDDKRIEAVKDIISDAVSQIIGLFKPAIQKYFAGLPSEGGASESSKLEKQSAEPSG